jgi:O-antigen/teichoic acid export membrane protein
MNIKTYLHSIKDKKKQDFFIYGTGQAFNLISPLLVAPYIVHVCNTAGLGKVGMGFNMALFLILIVDYAFEIKGPKEVSENRDNLQKLQEIANTTFVYKFLIFIMVAVVTSIIISCVPFLYKEKEVFFFSIAIIFAQVFNPSWFLQGVENFRLVSVLNIASKVSYMLLVYTIIQNEGDYIYVNLLVGGSTLVFNIIGLLYIKKKYAISVAMPAIREFVALLKADFSFCISQLFLSARQLSPLFIITIFLGPSIGGQYRIIEQVINMFRTFLQVLLRFFYPSVCYKISKNVQGGFNFWKKYTSACIALMFMVVVVMYTFATQILLFFKVSSNDIAALTPIFRFAMAIPLFMSLSYPLEQLMFAINKNKAYVTITIAVTLLTILLLTASVNYYGIKGSIASLLISEALCISLYFNYSYLFIKKQAKAYIKI